MPTAVFNTRHAVNVPTIDVGIAHDTGIAEQFYYTYKVGTNYVWLSTNPDNNEVFINTKPPVVSGHSAIALTCQQDPDVPLDGAELVLSLDDEIIGINGVIKPSSLCEVCHLELNLSMLLIKIVPILVLKMGLPLHVRNIYS